VARPKVVVDVPTKFHAGPGAHPGTGSGQDAHGRRANRPRRLAPGDVETPSSLPANRLFWDNVIAERRRQRDLPFATDSEETLVARPKVTANVPEKFCIGLNKPENAAKAKVARKKAAKKAAATRRRNAADGEVDTFAGDVDVEVTEDGDGGLVGTWEGVLAVEGSPTGDGRLMAPGSLRWAELPLPLRWVKQDSGEHKGAVTVGRILDIKRFGREIRGRGDLDLESEEGRELARLMAGDEDGPLMNGVSIDLDDVDVEVRVAAEVAEQMGTDLTKLLGGDDEDDDDGEGEAPEVDDEGRMTVKRLSSDDEMMVTTDGRIRAATVVQIPAFAEARLSLVPSAETEALAASAGMVLVASARKRPPRSWFDDPKFGSGPEEDARLVRDERQGVVGAPVTVTKDGRIFGHLALWGACHTGFQECVSPPQSSAGYRYFHVGAVECADGSEVATGRVTLDTLHAGRKMSAVDTLAHYENTGLAVADVVAGEDAYGIWIAGSLRSGVSPEQRAALKASPLSGDWRRIGGSLELVAALAVNSPGFPVPRAMVASGAVQSLQVGWETASEPPELSEDDLTTLRRVVVRERREEVEAARRKVLVASSVAKMRRR
jgi:hypothetical protein